MKNLHIENKAVELMKDNELILDKEGSKKMTGLASIDKPWEKWYKESEKNIEIPSINFYDFFKSQINSYPNINLLDFMGNISYNQEQIEKEIDNYIKMFTKMGVKKGERVSFMFINTPEVVFMIQALIKMGAVSNLIKFDESPERINFSLKLAKSKHFIVSEVPFIIENSLKAINMDNDVSKIISVPVAYSLGDKLSKLPKSDMIVPFNEVKENCDDVLTQTVSNNPDDTVVIAYTGGSTGNPKGVELTNKNLIAMTLGLKHSNFGFEQGKTSMNILPPAIAYYLNATIGLMVCGVKVILVPDFKIEEYPNLIDKYKPNIIYSGPILLKAMAKSNVSDFSYLTSPCSGGDKLLASEEEEINLEFKKRGALAVQQGYGASEETAVATCNPYNMRKVGSIGIPINGVSMAMFEYRTDKEIPYGKNLKGEICLTGPTVMKGYLENKEATNHVLIKHSDGTIWVHSDDFGIMDEDGFIFHKGRAKRMLTRNGGKVWLADIEEIAKTLPFIDDVCACKLDDEIEREVPVLHVVFKESNLDEQEMIEILNNLIKEKCQATFVPKYYIIKESLPYTETNKKLNFKLLESEDILDSSNYNIQGNIIKPIQKVKIKRN